MRSRSPLALLVLVLLSALLAETLAVRAAEADPSTAVNRPEDRGTARERFYPSDLYRGYYADPSVSLINGVYYTVGTSTDGVSLPLMTSTDLVTFRAREALPPAQNYTGLPGSNDAMSKVAGWPLMRLWGGRPRISVWAPSSILRVGSRYLLAYSSATAPGVKRRSCIGLAWADAPIGPFTDLRNRPVECNAASPLGAIDPDLHVDARGRLWLLWKAEGIVGRKPPRLMIRRLAADGSGFAPHSKRRVLLTRSARWEDGVVENPSMVTHRGRLYLFYSGGRWRSAGYGTGYAICRKVTGPCTKVTTKRPLLGSGGQVRGTGGADAIVDPSGRLRLVYAAWDAGRVGASPQYARRMHVATLGRGKPRRVKKPIRPTVRRHHGSKAAHQAAVKRARRLWRASKKRYRWAKKVEKGRLKVSRRYPTPWIPPGPLTPPVPVARRGADSR